MPQIYDRPRELPLVAQGSQLELLAKQRRLLEDLVTAADTQFDAALSRPWQAISIKRVGGASASAVLDVFEVEVQT